MAGEVHHLARERGRQRRVQLGVRVLVVEQGDFGRAGRGDHAEQGLLVRGPDHVLDLGHLVLVQRVELAGLHVQGADRAGRLAVALHRVDGAVLGDAGDAQVLAVVLGRAHQGPLAAIEAVQLGALVVVAFLVAAGGADREARRLVLAQHHRAVLRRRAAERDAAAGHGVHAHDLGAGALGRTRGVGDHDHVAVLALQRVEQAEALHADGLAALGGIAGAVIDDRARLAAVGVDRVPLAGAERRAVAAELLHRVEQQPVGADPVEAADALLVRQLVDLHDLEVAGAQDGEHVLVAAVHGDREVFAGRRDLGTAVGRVLDEVLDRRLLRRDRPQRQQQRGCQCHDTNARNHVPPPAPGALEYP